MFNIMSHHSELFFSMLSGFFSFFFIRHFCCKHSPISYHIIVSLICAFLALVRGSVQNDGYARLEKFIKLKQTNQLDEAKKNKQNDIEFKCDLEQFKTSDKFKQYLKENDNMLDKYETLFIAWLFVLLSDLAYILIKILRYIIRKRRKICN